MVSVDLPLCGLVLKLVQCTQNVVCDVGRGAGALDIEHKQAHGCT